MLRITSAALALVVSLACASAALAETSQKRLDLARRYIVALDMKKSLMPMMDSMTDVMLQQKMAELDLPEAKRSMVAKALKSAIADAMDEVMLEKMAGALEPALAEIFTDVELQAMVDFYESPVGRSIVAKMPAFGAASGPAMAKLMPEMQADLQKRIIENLSAIDLKGK